MSKPNPKADPPPAPAARATAPPQPTAADLMAALVALRGAVSDIQQQLITIQRKLGA